MKQKFLVVFVVLAILVFGFVGLSNATIIDFENYSRYTIITDQYSDMGVIFENIDNVSRIYDPYASCTDSITGTPCFPAYSGNHALCTGGPGTRIIFTNPVSSVSFYYTNGAAFGFEIFVYDSDDNILDSLTYYAQDAIGGGYIYVNNDHYYTSLRKPLLPNMLAEFNTPGISWLELQPNYHSGLTIDYLSFTQTPIPEPATMLLLGTGLVGFAGTKLRKKKK